MAPTGRGPSHAPRQIDIWSSQAPTNESAQGAHSQNRPGVTQLSRHLNYPGNGYPQRPDQKDIDTTWGELSAGQTIGKSSILVYQPFGNGGTSIVEPAPVDMLSVQGDDDKALQLVLTLYPPEVIPLSLAAVLNSQNQQNLSGSQTNQQFDPATFPETVNNFLWPIFQAVIQYGVGGVNTQIVVDFVNGATITLVASFIRVFAIVNQSPPLPGNPYLGTGAAYQLSAHLGPGFADTHAQNTVILGPIPDSTADSTLTAIPLYARTVLPFGTNIRPAPDDLPVVVTGYIRFYSGTQSVTVGALPGVADFFFSSNNPVPIPIPAPSMYFTIFNQSGIQIIFGAVFNLAD